MEVEEPSCVTRRDHIILILRWSVMISLSLRGSDRLAHRFWPRDEQYMHVPVSHVLRGEASSTLLNSVRSRGYYYNSPVRRRRSE